MNIRLPVELIRDMDLVASLLKVNKSEWMKTNLAKEVFEEKNRLLLELSTLYAKGMLTKKQIQKLVGKEIADQMEFIRKKALESARKGLKHGRKLK